MDVKMIRSVQPTSALPVTRNMPYHTASVPSRNQPRNMTGIYLGLEGNIKPPQNRTLIQFAKCRAGMSPKIRTTAEDRRYKKVELLRIKEETRGFKGQTVKNPLFEFLVSTYVKMLFPCIYSVYIHLHFTTTNSILKLGR